MKKILTLCLVFVILMSGFTTVLGATPPSVDKAEGVIDAAAGEFKITFAENVTKEMLNTISFKKKSGEALVDIKGGAFIEVDSTNPKIAVVKHGVLENKTDYVLTVGEDSYDYNVSEIEFKEDFEADSFVVGNQLAVRPSTVTEPVIYFPSTGEEPSGKATGSAECHYIGETADGDKYVALDPNIAGKDKNGRIVLEFPQPITEDEFCIDLKVRINGSYSSRNILYAHLASGTASGKKFPMAGVSEGKVVSPDPNAVNPGTVSGSSTLPTVGADGFYDLRMYLQRDADGSYTANLRNLDAFNEGMITVQSATGCDGLYCIWLTQFYASGAVKEGISVDLSYVKVHRAFETDIFQIDDIKKTDTEMGIVFTNDVNPETLSTLTMKDANENAVALTFDRYDEAARKAYYKFGQILTAETEYTLSLEGIKDKDGVNVKRTDVALKTEPDKYTLGTSSIVDQDGNAIDEIGNAEMLTYSNTVSAEVGKTFTLALAIFDSEGRFAEIISDTETVATGQTSVILQAVTPPEINLSDGYTIKTFVWEDETDVGNVFVAVTDVIE